MSRPDLRRERRSELLPQLARTFAKLGYRRATSAELARALGIQQAVLYRLWPGKQQMFIAALDHVYAASEQAWHALLARPDDTLTPAERILAFEARHQGEHGMYRLVFAGLSEVDDAEIAEALRRLYGRFQGFIASQVIGHRGRRASELPSPELTAWAILGLGTVCNIGRELELLPDSARRRLFLEAGQVLLGPRGQRPVS